MGWEQACTEFEINKQRRLLLISIKKKRERVNIQTSKQPGILFMKSFCCQSEPNREQITGPVKARRAPPVCKSNLGVGEKHTLAKGFGDIGSGMLEREL